MSRRIHHRCSLLRASFALATGLLCAHGAIALAADLPLHARIDAMIEADHVGTPAPLAGDAEFIRRVYLDLIGRVPPVAAVREFLSDTSAKKREALIDRLLADPAHVEHMVDVFDVMLMERRADKHVKAPEWRQFLRDSFLANKRLNVLAREILAADGVDAKLRPAVKFYLDREGETNLLSRDTGRIFFGMDLQCAQCHDHPVIDSYLQSDYYGIFAFFNRSFVFADKKAKKSFFAEKAEGDVKFTSVFTDESGATGPRLPGAAPVVEPTFKKGQEYTVKPVKGTRPVPKFSRRARLAELATNGENAAFNRNLANRLWAHMMGRGLVEPLDLHHPDNPPVHPALLQLLTDQLVALDFDAKAFLRQMALSRTYQRGFDMPTDLAGQADLARQQQAALQNEHQQCLAQAKQAGEAHLQAQVGRSEAKKAFDKLAPQWQQMEAALQAAQAESKSTAAKLAQTEVQLALKQPAGQSLAQAAQQTQQAAALLASTKSADAASLVELAKSLKTRSDQLAAESKKLAASQPGQQAARDKAAEKLAVAARQRDAIAATYEPIKQTLDQRQAALDEQRAAVESAKSVEALAKRRVEQARQLADLGQQITATEAASKQRQAVVQQIAEGRQALAAAATEAAKHRQTLADAGASAQTAEIQQRVSDADTRAAEMKKQVEQLESEQNRLGESLAAAAAQRDELLVSLTQGWSRRFTVASLKPLQPEQLAWSLMEATGMLDRYRASAVKDLDKKQPLKDPSDAAQRAERQRQVEAAVRAKLAGQVKAFIKLFGAGAGQPQDEFFATVDQALFFANGVQVRGWLAPSGTNLGARLAKLETPEAIADELYMSVFCRQPLQIEIDDVSRQLAARPKEKPAVVQDLAWALLTSAEFRFNH